MYTNIIYNISLNESLFESQKINDFSSIFSKCDIYSKNVRLINEGYSKLPKDIIFNANEKKQLNEMLSYIEYKLFEQYLNEGVWDSFKGLLNKGKEVAKNVWDYIKKLPQKIQNAVVLIEKVLQSGISKVSDFVKFIGNLLSKLGNSVKEAILSFGIFNDKDIANAPKLNQHYIKVVEDQDPKSKGLFSYVMRYVFERCADKSYTKILNEDTASYSDSTTSALDKWALSHKDSWLEKSKNNTLFRLFLSGTNASGERMGFFKVLLISIIGSFFVCTLVPLVAAHLGLTGVGLTALVFACKGLWVLKNVARIIINRTLTYKQSFTHKDGKVKHSSLFDIRTLISIAIAVITPTLFHIYHDEIVNWFHSLFHCEPPAEIIEQTDPEEIEPLIPEPTPEPVVEPVTPSPSPVPVIDDAMVAEVEPVTITEETPVITPEDVQGDVAVIKLEDAHDNIANVVDQSNAEEAVNQMNQVVNSHIEGDLNQFNINGDVEIQEITNIYNETARELGGMPQGVAIISDYGHPQYVYDVVHDHGGHIITTHGHCHSVHIPYHGAEHLPHSHGHFDHAHSTVAGHGGHHTGHGHIGHGGHVNGSGHGSHGGYGRSSFASGHHGRTAPGPTYRGGHGSHGGFGRRH